jgi:aarF domain-containing kinase
MISRDLSIMNFFANALSVFPGMQWLSLPEEVEVFGSMMNSQLDFRNEAENLELFESKFRARKAAVTFPRPLRNWSWKNILVEEYQEALPLEYFLSHKGGPFDEQIAQIGLDAFLVCFLHHD